MDLKILDETKLLVSFLAFCVLVYTRTVHVFFVVTGACTVAVWAKCLKILLRQPRPRHDPLHKRDYGMPSSHAAVMVYFATYLDFTAAVPSPFSAIAGSPGCVDTYLPITNSPTRPFYLLLGFFMHCFVASELRSRVNLYHHTVRQVIAGAALGALMGFAWWYGWHRWVYPLLHDWEWRELVSWAGTGSGVGHTVPDALSFGGTEPIIIDGV